MSKKKHPEHVNHERWLVSYADFITLLFAFFVVLFASGQNDKRKTVKLAQAMQSAFQYNGIFDPHSKTPPISDDPTTSSVSNPSPIALPMPSAAELEKAAEEKTRARIETVIEGKVLAKEISASAVTLRASTEGLVISLREAGFFDSGSAEIRPQALGVFRSIAATLPESAMRVEGHTDDVPIHTPQFATNWELSGARAADVTRLLIAQRAVKPNAVSASGYAEFQPVASNATEAGRQQNRRVDIILLKAAPAAHATEADAAGKAGSVAAPAAK